MDHQAQDSVENQPDRSEAMKTLMRMSWWNVIENENTLGVTSAVIGVAMVVIAII